MSLKEFAAGTEFVCSIELFNCGFELNRGFAVTLDDLFLFFTLHLSALLPLAKGIVVDALKTCLPDTDFTTSEPLLDKFPYN